MAETILRNETKPIDGHTYRVTMLPYKKGQRLLVKLFKLAGPALGEVFAGMDPSKPSIGGMKGAAAGAALAELAERLQLETFDELVDTLAEYTELQVETPEGGEGWVRLKQQIEFHFAGEYWRMLQWLGFALQVNYLGFLKGRGGLEAVLARIKATMRSPSPASSTGPSGASSPPSASAG